MVAGRGAAASWFRSSAVEPDLSRVALAWCDRVHSGREPAVKSAEDERADGFGHARHPVFDADDPRADGAVLEVERQQPTDAGRAAAATCGEATTGISLPSVGSRGRKTSTAPVFCERVANARRSRPRRVRHGARRGISTRASFRVWRPPERSGPSVSSPAGTRGQLAVLRLFAMRQEELVARRQVQPPSPTSRRRSPPGTRNRKRRRAGVYGPGGSGSRCGRACPRALRRRRPSRRSAGPAARAHPCAEARVRRGEARRPGRAARRAASVRQNRSRFATESTGQPQPGRRAARSRAPTSRLPGGGRGRAQQLGYAALAPGNRR